MCTTCGCDAQSDPQLTHLPLGQVSCANASPVDDIAVHQHVLADGTIVTHSHDDHSHSHQGHAHSHHTHSHSHQSHAHSHDDHRHSHPDHRQSDPPHDRGWQGINGAKPAGPSHHQQTLVLEQEILAKNNLIAAQNRGWFRGRQIVALNLVSSPGAGKTTLLSRTIQDLSHNARPKGGSDWVISVIEGDQATLLDAQRIQAAGANVVQINTGAGCHLDAAMIDRAIHTLNPPLNSLVMIENVGNLVCPALFDIGETAKVVILSVTEGEDKPLKYPHMFQASQVMILNKIDLLPYLSFDVEACLAFARQVNPDLQIFQVSATTGAGLTDWYAWLYAQRYPSA